MALYHSVNIYYVFLKLKSMNVFETYTDEQLVNLIYLGQYKAFEALLFRHKERIYSYIMNMVRDEDLANDIFQETFIKVITTIKQGKYSESGKFIPWVTRISHNLVIDFFRKKNSDKTVSNINQEGNDIFDTVSLCDNSIQDIIEKEESYGDILKLISLLPNDQQRVIKLRFYSNLSFKEIAEHENISINTALGRIRYAILNMRKNAIKYNVMRDLERMFC